MKELSKIFSYITCFSMELLIAALILAFSQRRRKRFWLRLLSCTIVFTVMFDIYPGEIRWLQWLNLGLNHFYLFVFVLVFLLVWFCFSISWKTALFYTISAYIIQHFVSNLSFVVQNINAIYSPSFNIRPWINIFQLPVFFCLTALVRYFYGRRANATGQVKIKNLPMLFLSVFMLAFLVYARQIFNMVIAHIGSADRGITIFYCLYASFFSIVMFALLVDTIEKQDVMQENKQLEAFIERQDEFRKNYEESVQIINIKCHDLKKQISYIKSLNNSEKAAKLLEQAERAVMIYSNIATTGNRTLDYLLMEKGLQCENKKIQFSYMVDGEALSYMEEGDIYSLFANALDNAIECVESYPEEKRVISMRVSRTGNILNVVIDNYCERDITYEDGFPKTTKKDADFHGYGLKSIVYIVKKYGGEVNIRNAGRIYSLGVVMPLLR